MSKKIIVALISATLAFVLVFAACNKAVYKDQSGKEYLLVTDENGEKILNDDGELLVYVTDEKGKIQKDESGNPVTEMQGFVGQIEENGTVEDYAYKVALPSGWKIAADNGKYENESRNEKIEISVEKYFYDDYVDFYRNNYKTIKASLKDSGDENNASVTWDENVKYKAAKNAASQLTIKAGDSLTIVLIFENNSNVYNIRFTAENSEQALSDFDEFINSVEYKNYQYWDDVTHVSTTADESGASTDTATATATTAAKTTAAAN